LGHPSMKTIQSIRMRKERMRIEKDTLKTSKAMTPRERVIYPITFYGIKTPCINRYRIIRKSLTFDAV